LARGQGISQVQLACRDDHCSNSTAEQFMLKAWARWRAAQRRLLQVLQNISGKLLAQHTVLTHLQGRAAAGVLPVHTCPVTPAT
jgi:hypothetical protein